ncbi:MAG: Gfo/Idh/MocA family oxidoreductase [Candidatus Lernaella stagnicola]|nr:Gfo/Idh/MocA family oxidoreductase [Candidatus Lernaella stagnicola]
MVHQPLRAAMIGVGDITMLHQPAYQDFALADLTALCDVDEDMLAARRAEWGVERITTDYKELLADPEIDLVEVNTPHHLHKDLVIDALAAGKHVACQKPISISIADAEAMLAAAEKASGRFRVFENFVFYPPYVKAKELIDAGEIGEVLTIRFKLGTCLFGSRWVPLRAELWHLLEYEHGRGQAIFDDGYHKLSMAIFLGGAIEAVKGFTHCSMAYIDEPAQVIWCYRDKKLLGSFDIAFQPNIYNRSKYFPADERINIIGTKGMIELTCCTGQIMDEAGLILYRDGVRYCFDDLDLDWKYSFINGIRDFPAAIRENRECLLTGERALNILKFAYAIIIAGRIGREVKPEEVSDEWFREVVHGRA